MKYFLPFKQYNKAFGEGIVGMYMTTVQAAEKWGISATRVLMLIKSGRVPHAVQIGSHWMIPEDAEKPADGRTKSAKERNDFFRYPIFEYKKISSFSPPLSEEELRIKKVLETFRALDFAESEKTLGNLSETSGNRYHRLFALFAGCLLDVFYGDIRNFNEKYSRLLVESSGDFPHNKEMQEYPHEINAILTTDKYYVKEFKIEPSYAYHETFLPRLTTLSAISLAHAYEKKNLSTVKAYEISLLHLQQTDNYTDTQNLHLYLGCAYSLMGMSKEATYHFREALFLAQKYRLFYDLLGPYYYMRKAFEPAIADFSAEFKDFVEKKSVEIHNRYVSAANTLSLKSIYNLLPSKDYIYIFYAAQGYTNKEVASHLNISENSVGKHYSLIYETLGLKSKHELVDYYFRFIDFSQK